MDISNKSGGGGLEVQLSAIDMTLTQKSLTKTRGKGSLQQDDCQVCNVEKAFSSCCSLHKFTLLLLRV